MRYLLVFVFLIFNSVHAAETSVIINEIMPHPSSGEDWVELYNPTTQTVNLVGWTVSDSTSVIKTLSGTLDPSSLLIVNLTNRLNNGGDSVILKDSAQVIIDQYTYAADPGIDQSISRTPDGGSWPSASPSPSNSPTPSPGISSSPSPSPSSSPNPEMTFSLSQNSFAEDQELIVNAALTHFPSQTTYYIKGAFFKDGSTNYFGQTLVNNNWVRNLQSYSAQLPITTDQNGSWSGTVKIKTDTEDSGYSGPGGYQLKIGRYTDSGQGPSWSNSQAVKITAAPIVTSPIPTKSTVPVSISAKKPATQNSIVLPSSILGEGTKSAEVAEATPASFLFEKSIPPNPLLDNLIWIGLGLMTFGSSLLLFLSTKHPTIAGWYGRQIVQIRHNKLLQTWLNKLRPQNQIEQ